MNGTVNRTPKSGRQSLFFQDLATPVSARRGKFSSTGQAAAVSALWRENFGSSDLPPPPLFTLEDRTDFSPESGIPDYPLSPSPEVKSDPRTPSHGFSQDFSTPSKGKSEASTSYALSSAKQLQTQKSAGSASWWSPTTTPDALTSGKTLQAQKASGNTNWWSTPVTADGSEEKGKGSPVKGVVEPGALLTLPPPREVARPEMLRNSLPAGNLDEEEWVTVYGFPPGDTNFVLREFEKCGIIVKHIPGPGNANWMHILYQSRSDAQKALNKNGIQINGVLIVGVKPIDPIQRQALDERSKNQGFLPLPPSTGRTFDPIPPRSSSNPSSIPNGNASSRQSGGAIASPAKSVVSKIMDLMFGV
ncbi:hypothetical protein MLD38_005238 [Melastoma candidum]|uniref:Uncharacterized protein n=1 Tax=Melastoma candidum TaxID=119954 RepID=A0ACB9S890_9MYRT|nr:hypothetical protein MLD38_005238 [Melastoma candidum]